MRTAGSNPTHVVTLVYTTLGLVLFVIWCSSVRECCGDVVDGEDDSVFAL